MNFSKSFLEDLRNSISLADLIGEKVSWDQKKTRVGQGDFWAPCPFHEEKTASFHVDSTKGFYYCFGCHAKGDCYTFLKEYENLSFLESVTYLSQKGGVPLPVSNYKTEKHNENELELLRAHVEAAKFFEEQLKKTTATACREYLKNREISEEAKKHFGIGFSPNSRNTLYRHLRDKNFSADIIVASGLCMLSEKENKPFDRFRNRVMFPIKDPQKRIVAFGGRSLDSTAQAKYLNSPETPLFSKGKILYNYSNAKAASKSKNPLLLVEGYMDVIALFQAGLHNTVAPLGTAITENQLRLIWRLDNEPVVLFDGDKAGRKAGRKLLSLSLPFIEPEKSMRFAMLPIDQDPDDFLKSEGREGLDQIVATALPAIQILWTDLTDGKVFDSPERKASLDLKVREQIAKIKNSHLRNHFTQAINQIRKQFFSKSLSSWEKMPQNNVNKFILGKIPNTASPLLETKNSLLGRHSSQLDIELRLKEGAIILGSINHPSIAQRLETDLSRLNFTFNDLKRIRDAILEELPVQKNMIAATFQQKIKIRLNFDPVETLKKIPHLNVHPFLRLQASKVNAEKAIQDAIIRHNSLLNFKAEIKIAEDQFHESASEEITSRIQKANKILQKAIRGSELQEFNNDELKKASSERLNLMIQDKIWLKKK